MCSAPRVEAHSRLCLSQTSIYSARDDRRGAGSSFCDVEQSQSGFRGRHGKTETPSSYSEEILSGIADLSALPQSKAQSVEELAV